MELEGDIPFPLYDTLGSQMGLLLAAATFLLPRVNAPVITETRIYKLLGTAFVSSVVCERY